MLWLIIGLVVGIGILALVLWLRNRDITVRWYEWLVGALGALLLLASVQHLIGSLSERYPTAGMFGLAVFGIPALILLAVVWQLVSRRQRASS
jgi:hypothetical protein